MDEAQRGELEGDLRRRLEHDDFEGAATQAVRGYGPEIFAFLLAIHRDEDDASEVFSRFAEGYLDDTLERSVHFPLLSFSLGYAF